MKNGFVTSVHWLVNNSELYKKSDIVVYDNWFQEITESAEDTIREFLEVSTDQTKDNMNIENTNISITNKDIAEYHGYDSDQYSEIDTNDHVRNIDTLVDDADIENKYDQVFTFAPGEGQHPLSFYQDKDAEYLCFPSIFCDQRPPSKDERSEELRKVMNEYKETVDMTFEEFLEKVIQMIFEDYIRCIKISLNAPKVFLKRKSNEMRINLFNGKILLAWKANLDIQTVLEPYGYASYFVGYIRKSQRGMSARLDAAAKEETLN